MVAAGRGGANPDPHLVAESGQTIPPSQMRNSPTSNDRGAVALRKASHLRELSGRDSFEMQKDIALETAEWSNGPRAG